MSHFTPGTVESYSEHAHVHHVACAVQQHWLQRNDWKRLKKSFGRINTAVRDTPHLTRRTDSWGSVVTPWAGPRLIKGCKKKKKHLWTLQARLRIRTANISLLASWQRVYWEKWTATWAVSITTRSMMKTASSSLPSPSEKDTLVSFHVQLPVCGVVSALAIVISPIASC